MHQKWEIQKFKKILSRYVGWNYSGKANKIHIYSSFLDFRLYVKQNKVYAFILEWHKEPELIWNGNSTYVPAIQEYTLWVGVKLAAIDLHNIQVDFPLHNWGRRVDLAGVEREKHRTFVSCRFCFCFSFLIYAGTAMGDRWQVCQCSDSWRATNTRTAQYRSVHTFALSFVF